MRSAELIEDGGRGLIVNSDETDPLQVESGIYAPFPIPEEKPRVEMMHPVPPDELKIRKPSKAAINNSGLELID